MDAAIEKITNSIKEQQKKVDHMLEEETGFSKTVEELETQIASLSGIRKMTQGNALKQQLDKAKEKMRNHIRSRETAENGLKAMKSDMASEKERFEKQIELLEHDVDECEQHIESARKNITDSAVDIDAFISEPFLLGKSGNKPIEWKILKVEPYKMLIVASYGLTAHVFHEGNTFPGWGNSDIREWLNSEFIDHTFNEEERSLLKHEPIITYVDPESDRTVTTEDKVFLLSIEEVEHYFPEKADRKLLPSEYASNHGVHAYNGDETEYKIDDHGCCWWWLRSPAYDKRLATCVYLDGGFVNRTVNAKVGAVRPAVWLSFNKEDIMDDLQDIRSNALRLFRTNCCPSFPRCMARFNCL